MKRVLHRPQKIFKCPESQCFLLNHKISQLMMVELVCKEPHRMFKSILPFLQEDNISHVTGINLYLERSVSNRGCKDRSRTNQSFNSHKCSPTLWRPDKSSFTYRKLVNRATTVDRLQQKLLQYSSNPRNWINCFLDISQWPLSSPAQDDCVPGLQPCQDRLLLL